PSHHALHSFPTRRSSDLSATTSSFGARQRRFEEPADLFVADAAIAKAANGAGDERLRFAKCLAPFPRPSVLRYECAGAVPQIDEDRKSTRLNSSHVKISY